MGRRRRGLPPVGPRAHSRPCRPTDGRAGGAPGSNMSRQRRRFESVGESMVKRKFYLQRTLGRLLSSDTQEFCKCP